jgi:hypothetical protein
MPFNAKHPQNAKHNSNADLSNPLTAMPNTRSKEANSQSALPKGNTASLEPMHQLASGQ